MFTFLRKKALLAILFLMSGIISSFATPSGSGTEADPYLIGSAEDLVWFREYVNGSYRRACAKLTEDIDLKDVCHPASDGVEEVSWVPINTYTGTFDGNNKKIKNLYYSDNNADEYNAGAFIKEISSGTIKGLSFTNAIIIGTDGIYAVVAAEADNATINNITIESGYIHKTGTTGRITQACGSISANASECRISNCTNRINIESYAAINGGICGKAGSCTITNCCNFGKMTGGSPLGGIIGLVNSYFNNDKTFILRNCANYGDIESTESIGSNISIGGIIGEIYDSELTLDNVFHTGNITCNATYAVPGFIIGNTANNTVIPTGIIAYNNSRTIKKKSIVLPSVAAGEGTVNKVYSFDAETIKYGILAALLQQNATDGTIWGQQLGTDDYPVLGSTNRVYAIKDIHMTCLGTIQETDALSNTASETEGTITISHCDNPTHHEAVAATCTTDGNVEYYECTICHHNFSSSDMLQEIAPVVIHAMGHDYVDNVCTRCNNKVATDVLSKGTSTIYIKKVSGTREEIDGYNLYKFTALGDGTLTVYTTGELDTYGTLWDSSQTQRLTYNDDSGEGSNFKFTYEVTKGTVYYIGVRQYNGNEIGYYTITVEGTWPDNIDELSIKDNETLDLPNVVPVTTLTYKRTFNNTNWQPLYVPFAMASADWKDKGLEVACINNFHEYNTSEGKKVVLEVNRVTAGVLHPNTPYLIRATEEGEKTITLNDVTLQTVEDTYTCSSMTRNYNFKGIYSEKSSFDADNDYIVSGGSLMHISDDAVLSPQRWYVHVDNRYTMIDAEEAAAQARSISIVVVGESSVTGIEEVGVKVDDISSDAQGIYDLQGRRLGSAPKQGVFIMNGKKFVK